MWSPALASWWGQEVLVPGSPNRECPCVGVPHFLPFTLGELREQVESSLGARTGVAISLPPSVGDETNMRLASVSHRGP